MKSAHVPVLVKEVLDFFNGRSVKVFVDVTLGAGGHAEALLQQHPEIECFVGIDRDAEACHLAEERLAFWKPKVIIKQGNFSSLDTHLQALGVQGVDGIFADLGVSSMQLDQAERGFSFSKSGPLDMRMDTGRTLTAEEVVNTFSEEELGRIFRDYGEERRWRTAAAAVVKARQDRSLHSTQDLVAALEPVFPKREERGRGRHPMTLIFQALRIAVNGELEALESFLPAALESLKVGGRLGVISYHSLEDRRVKNIFRFFAADKYDSSGIGGMFLDKTPQARLLTRKAVVPMSEEIEDNPRSRSAKMRFVEKL